ncbi:single-stranded DNA-binding protein [Candidatus Pacearchaeota archaeon]|nr:single-stranded DNA-binding protein [Candidatus Pacearchaeota archaeon]
MPNVNQVILAGHISKEPVLEYLPSQTAVCNFALAINKKYTDSGGAKKEKVCFIDCAIFGKRAEAFHKYLKKGQPVLVTGELTYQQWESNDGQKRSKHEVTVKDFNFLGSGKKGDKNES